MNKTKGIFCNNHKLWLIRDCEIRVGYNYKGSKNA
jgi:hypothetical protein